MARISLSKFSKNYGLMLLPYSASNFAVGYKAEWKGRIRRRFQIENNFIFNYFPFSVPQKDRLLRSFQKLNSLDAVDAQFASLDLSGSTEVSAGLGATSLGKIVEANAGADSIFSFSFDGVRAKILSGSHYNDFLQLLMQLEQKSGDFKKRENKLMFVEQLFYADSVTIHVSKEIGAGIKAKAAQFNIEAIVERETSMDITFSNNHSPFAIKLKTIDDFMH